MGPFQFWKRMRDSSPAIFSGDTVPTDASSGYPIGSIFVQTDGVAGTCLYVNEGTATSCDFNAVVTGAGGATIAASKTLAVTTADYLTVGGVKVGTSIVLAIPFRAAADLVDQWVFIADRAYEVTAVKEIHAVASTSGTVLPRVITDTSAPGDADNDGTVQDLITAALNTNTTANTTQSGTLTANVTMAAGNKIGLKTGGTTTSLAGGVLTIVLKAI